MVKKLPEVRNGKTSAMKRYKKGIIIKPFLMRVFEKTSYEYGPYSFDINKIEKNYDDYFHTWLDHDLMYKRFDVIGSEILYFYKNGTFTKQAKRNKYNWDSFKKIRL